MDGRHRFIFPCPFPSIGGVNLRALAVASVLAATPVVAFAADDDWQAQVGQALGKSGSAMAGGVYRVALPRTDLKATLDGVELKPGFALGGWLDGQ